MKKNIATLASKNALLSIMVAFALGTSFAACSSNDDDNHYIQPAPTTTDTTEKSDSTEGGNEDSGIASLIASVGNDITKADKQAAYKLVSAKGTSTYGKVAFVITTDYFVNHAKATAGQYYAKMYDGGDLIFFVNSTSTSWDDVVTKLTTGEENLLTKEYTFKQKRLSEVIKENMSSSEFSSAKYIAICLGQVIYINE